MIRSMTAFTQYEFSGEYGKASWEIRSVNQRYLETYIKLPEQLRSLEPLVREQLRHRLSRGKVECTLRFEASINSEENQFIFNESLARQLLQAAKWIIVQHGEGNVNPLDILKWPGVISTNEQDLDTISTTLLEALESTLKLFIATREREGKALKAFIEQRLVSIEEEISKVRSQMPEVMKWQRERLIKKLEEASLVLEKNRLEQELLLIAQRIDVEEELNRIEMHVRETRSIIEEKQVIGRKLDFMMQEFNREANTLASKSINSKITASAIELKILIEQMREHIQNTE